MYALSSLAKFPSLPKSSFPQIYDANSTKFSPHSHSIQPYSPQKHAVVKIPPKHSLISLLFKNIDGFISNFLDDLPYRPSIDPKHVLSGNFRPVPELPPTPCHVAEGTLPPSLDGVYIRNGPNPHFPPSGPYHLFDGDGMLHAVRISDGAAWLCSRYVKTHKFMIENELGYAFLQSPFSAFNGLWASLARSALAVAQAVGGYFHPKLTGYGTANTSVAMVSGVLCALVEADLPYSMKVTPAGEIITMGRHDFGGDNLLRITAHPKTDRDTGEAFVYTCDIFEPYLTFFRIDHNGLKNGRGVPIFSVIKQSFVHDFAITAQFIIFQDIQVAVNPYEIVKGRSPVVYNADKVPRIGVLPRQAEDESELTWVETPGFNMLHVTNAWEEDSNGRIVIVAPNVLSIEAGFAEISSFETVLEKVVIDIRTRKVVVRETLSARNLEFGAINPAYAGKKNRYVYAAMIDEMPKASGVVKLDLTHLGENGTNCTVASRLYGRRCYGGEPHFVPRQPDNPDADEDDGYILTYMHDENTEESWFLVMDAKSNTLDIVAKVKLPGRVPYGFHGLFVNETDLRNMQ